MELIFKAPGKDAKGFLRRAIRAGELGEALKSGTYNAVTLREMADFLADYIDAPRAQAIDAILDASQDEFMQMFNAIGGGHDSTIPPESGDPS